MRFARIWLLVRLMVFGLPQEAGMRFVRTARRQQKLSEKAQLLLQVGLALYVAWINFRFGHDLRATADSMPGIVLGMCLLLLFFGFFMMVTFLYHGKENSLMRSLPFTGVELSFARLGQLYFYLMGLVLLLFLPLFVGYGVASQAPIFYYPGTVIYALFMPVTAMGLWAMALMLLMRFTKFFRNKDRFTLVMSVLLIGGAVLLPIFLGSKLSMETLNMKRLQLLLYLFPGSRLAQEALMATSLLPFLWKMGLYLLSAVGLLLLLGWTAKYHYLPGAMQSGKGDARRKAMRPIDFERMNQRRSPLWALCLREWRLLSRTPAYLMNNLLGLFIMPVILLGMTGFAVYESGGMTALFGLRETVSEAVQDALQTAGVLEGLLPWFFVGSFVTGLASVGMGGLPSGAITREGSEAYVMLLLPVSLEKQLFAKGLLAMGLSLLTILLLVFFLLFLLPFHPVFFLFLFLLLLGAICSTVLGLLCDALRPKLHWASEIEATKRNWNAMLHMLASGLVGALLFWLVRMGQRHLDLRPWQYLAFLLFFGLGLFLVLLLVLKARLPKLKKIIGRSEGG